VSLPQIFGDERDAIIAKWNQLQALWGSGKGYYNRNQCVEFKPDNPFCKFKVRLVNQELFPCPGIVVTILDVMIYRT